MARSVAIFLMIGLMMATTLVVLRRPGFISGTRLPGVVLSLGADGRFEMSSPDGRHVVTAAGLVQIGNPARVVLAADGSYLITATGQLIHLSGGDVVVTGRSVLVRRGQIVTGLAAHNRAVIIVGGGNPATYPVYATPFGQPSISLGYADSVAGDPQQTGVIVSVGESQLINPGAAGFPGASRDFTMMDVRVELRDAGRPTVVLDRAAQLNAALRQPPNTPLQILVVPSPTGELFALEATPATSGSPWDGVIVVDRQGTILGAGADLQGFVSWSPNGQSLAYPEMTDGHLDIAVWTIGHQTELYQGPKAVSGSGHRCLWAPTGDAVLCVAATVPRERTRWLVARLHRTNVTTYAGSLLPLAWLPAPRHKPSSP